MVSTKCFAFLVFCLFCALHVFRSFYVSPIKRVVLSDSVLPLGSQKCETIQQLNLKKYFIIDRGIALSAFMSSITAPFCDLLQ